MYYPSLVSQSQTAVTMSAGDRHLFAPMTPIHVIRWGFMTSVDHTVTLPELGLDLRLTVNDNSGRIVNWGGTLFPLTLPLRGDGFQHTLIEGEGAVALDPRRKNGVVNPGEELVIDVQTASSVSGAFPFIEYEPLSGQGVGVLVSDGGIFVELAS